MDTIPEPPEKPSDLIKLALADVDSLDRSVYVIKTFLWHTYDGERCCVCLAGAVIANTLRRPIERTIESLQTEADYDPLYAKWLNHLLALNSFRTGDLFSGLIRLGMKLPEGMPDQRPPTLVDLGGEGDNYYEYSDDWRANTEWCLAELLKHGL